MNCIHNAFSNSALARLLVRVMLVALTGCALRCGAVTLGGAMMLSGPSQPLRVEIELTSQAQPRMQVRLASEQAFHDHGIAYPAWLGRAQVSLLPAQGSRRHAAVLLTAPQAVQAEWAALVLEFSWPTGGTQQVYVLRLDGSSLPKDADTAAGASASGNAGSTAAANAAKPGPLSGMTFEMALRFPVKAPKHAGPVSAQHGTTATAGPPQDRLRLARTESAQVERIAQERRQAGQQTRMQELARNARQMRELAAEATAASAEAGVPSPVPPPPPALPFSAAHAPQQQTSRHAENTPGRPSMMRFAVPLLLLAGVMVFYFTRRWRRRHRANGIGIARPVLRPSPAKTAGPYATRTPRGQTRAKASPSQLENARALFALGRFSAAQKLLDEIILVNPRSHETWFLLVRVLRAREDRAGFARLIPMLREVTGATGELWDQTLALGHELDPDNPLYQAAGAQPRRGGPKGLARS